MNLLNRASESPDALLRCTVFGLDESPTRVVRLRAGDTLRSESGVAWGTVDGRVDDVLVLPDRPHVVRGDADMRLSGFGGPAVLAIVSGQSLAVVRTPRGSSLWWTRLNRHAGAAHRVRRVPA